MSLLISILNVVLVLSSVFLIGLVLIQRGKGGGLAGAFGGMGGSSAFGAKAGDVFTKVTIRTAVVWFVLNMALVFLMNRGIENSNFSDSDADTQESGTITPGAKGKGIGKGTVDDKSPKSGVNRAKRGATGSSIPERGTTSRPAPATGKASTGGSKSPAEPN